MSLGLRKGLGKKGIVGKRGSSGGALWKHQANHHIPGRLNCPGTASCHQHAASKQGHEFRKAHALLIHDSREQYGDLRVAGGLHRLALPQLVGHVGGQHAVQQRLAALTLVQQLEVHHLQLKGEFNNQHIVV